MATINQIFKTYVEPTHPKLKFAEWIETEKRIYKQRFNGKADCIGFDNWINKRYTAVKNNFLNEKWAETYSHLNAEGDEEKKSWLDGALSWAQGTSGKVEQVAGKVNEVATAAQNGTQEDTPPVDDKKPVDEGGFLGLPKGLAIGLGILVVGGAIATTVYFVRKSGKNK